MPNTADFPKALREFRKEKGLTQKQLGTLLECSRWTISNYERGRCTITSDKAEKLTALGFDSDKIPRGRRSPAPYSDPFTDEERRFAGKHHSFVYAFLKKNGLPYDDWYDIIVFGYLRAVKNWFARPELHKYSFFTVAYKHMLSSVGNERRKQKRRPVCVSLDDVIPFANGLTYEGILCDPRDCVGI